MLQRRDQQRRADVPRKSPLSITSISEDRLLRALGLSRTECHQIGGLSSSAVDERGGNILSEEQLVMVALVRLANEPRRMWVTCSVKQANSCFVAFHSGFILRQEYEPVAVVADRDAKCGIELQ